MKTTRWTPFIELYEATIDGQTVRGLKCFAADEEEGALECYFTDPTSGRVSNLRDQDDNLRSYTRYGKVTITPPDPQVLQAAWERRTRIQHRLRGSA